MHLEQLYILNYKNIEEADLQLSEKMNCFVGDNGMGKTNVLDAVYYLALTKSAFLSQDSLNIRHGAEFALLKGTFQRLGQTEQIDCGIKPKVRKQFRRNGKEYQRLTDHIGLFPLVLVSPKDIRLIEDGSDERRQFIDSIISQIDKTYLNNLLRYNQYLKQRNALLKQMADKAEKQGFATTQMQFQTVLQTLNEQMSDLAKPIFECRNKFVELFNPIFKQVYSYLASNKEEVELSYHSQLHQRDMLSAMQQTLERDLILGWTSQGIHKDDIEMSIADYPLKQVGSQGQQKTFLVALKLSQAIYLFENSNETNTEKPILLLDDIFDKLDSERVGKIIELVQTSNFGQIFITDTDRQHITELIKPFSNTAKVLLVENGKISNYKNL
ncbi:MAG: DNA replication/repair protein RecF [Paludibacteraceae bacterium]|nr:DNA replication/repair protein RecF [Paludibacteraceae bacterium]